MTALPTDRPTEPPAVATPTDQIRSATRAHHEAAEHADFQRRLVAGKHDRAAYAAWLAQFLVLHRTLEALEQRGARPADAGRWPIQSQHARAALIEADLRALGQAPEAVTPLPATQAFAERCRHWAADPREAWRLLGVWYVLEGATNGNRYIARNVRRGAGLEGPEGTRYLDPYGEAQPAQWAAFKEAFNAAVPPTAVASVVAAACDTYAAVTDMGEALAAQFPG